MLKLAERMVISFCAGVSASTAHTWTTLSGTGAEDVRVMTRKSVDDPGRPPGIVLSAATSFWIPVPPKRVFDFLRDENSRNEVSCAVTTLSHSDLNRVLMNFCETCSGIFCLMEELCKKWHILLMGEIPETVFLFFG